MEVWVGVNLLLRPSNPDPVSDKNHSFCCPVQDHTALQTFTSWSRFLVQKDTLQSPLAAVFVLSSNTHPQQWILCHLCTPILMVNIVSQYSTKGCSNYTRSQLDTLHVRHKTKKLLHTLFMTQDPTLCSVANACLGKIHKESPRVLSKNKE